MIIPGTRIDVRVAANIEELKKIRLEENEELEISPWETIYTKKIDETEIIIISKNTCLKSIKEYVEQARKIAGKLSKTFTEARPDVIQVGITEEYDAPIVVKKNGKKYVHYGFKIKCPGGRLHDSKRIEDLAECMKN